MPIHLSDNDLRELLADTGIAPAPADHRAADARLFCWLALAIGGGFLLGMGLLATVLALGL